MPQKAWSKKQERQYQHVKSSQKDEDRSEGKGGGDRRPHREQAAGTIR